MRAKIASDIPGRIRVRYGRDIFLSGDEPAVEAYFAALPFVEGARACSRTGSVLIRYASGCGAGAGAAASARAGTGAAAGIGAATRAGEGCQASARACGQAGIGASEQPSAGGQASLGIGAAADGGAGGRPSAGGLKQAGAGDGTGIYADTRANACAATGKGVGKRAGADGLATACGQAGNGASGHASAGTGAAADGGARACARSRAELLAAAGALCFSSLAPAKPDGGRDGQRLIDEHFLRRLFSSVGRQLILSLLLPAPIRRAVTAARFLRFAKKGWASAMGGKIGVEVLDASAIGVSIAQGNFGTASSIMFMLGLSEQLESYAMKKTKNALSGSLLINAETAWVERGGREFQVPASQLESGDLVIARTGATIPVDGAVARGEAIVNQSAMTGEPLGVFKKAGDSVYAGTVVEDGTIAVRASALASDARVMRIVDMISESESLKASVQGRAERVADGIVPFSFLLAAGIFALTRNPAKALSVLLVDYSCAIKLATPISVISAMREASGLRIVVKGGKHFESVAEADTVVFDKTGTLTKARPSVSRVVPMPGYSREEVLRLAACMEEHFPHSVASAIVRAAKNEGLRHEEEHAEVKYVVAHGIATAIHGKKAVIGSRHFIFDDEGITASAEQQALIDGIAGADAISGAGAGTGAGAGDGSRAGTEIGAGIGADAISGAGAEAGAGAGPAVFLAVDGSLAGFICISDPLRDEAREAVLRLRALGVREAAMLTGDSEQAARRVCGQLGLDSFRAQILPEDKAAAIEAIKRSGRKAIMVGDGINASPALAAADVS
ncbi:MAG: HAD-IC family P-type ATPase, partial [Clostridiales bacterium]|nr:HAD-IC family P-type ATPase [Clostridiales bacterium]